MLDPALTWEHHVTMIVHGDAIMCLLECASWEISSRASWKHFSSRCWWSLWCVTVRIYGVVHALTRKPGNKKYWTSQCVSSQTWRNGTMYQRPATNSDGQSVDKMIVDCDVALLNRIMAREEAPQAVKALLTFRSEVTDRSTRSAVAAALQLSRVRTELARRSFYYRAPHNWNSQDVATRQRLAAIEF